MGSFDLGSLNVVDIVILVIFLVSIIIGFGRGLVSEVLSLVILIAAFIVAIMFTNTLATYFTNTAAVQGVVSQTSTAVGTSTSQPAVYMAIAVSFAILFAGTIIIGFLVKMLLNLMLSTSVLGFGNRVLGGLFGFVRGGLLNMALIFLVQLSPFSKEPWWQESHYVPYFQPYMEKLGNTISPELSNLKSTFSAPNVDGMTKSLQEKVETNTTDTTKTDTKTN